MKAENYLREFENPSSRFRGAPFWSWNCKLDKETMLRQIDYFQEMGMGGFTMHCRTGLATPYLGPEFMEVIKACVEKAKKLGMKACLYDEDRWPSGFAGGEVTKDTQYRSRYLVVTPYSAEELLARGMTENISAAHGSATGTGTLLARYEVILQNGCLSSYRRLKDGETGENIWYAYLEISGNSSWYNNQAYVDALNKKAIQRFIETTHVPYRNEVGEEFGKTIPSIFTDEPQFIRKSSLGRAEDRDDVILPYTDDFEDTYRAAYGKSLLDCLPEVIWELPEGAASLTRYRYHDHLAERFAEAFSDTLGDWCEKNGLPLTGHLMEEPTLGSQTEALGEAMRHYRGFGIPGIDILCDYREYTTAKQAQSAAHQLGRNEVTSELYGVTGWDFDFRGHKLQGDWQAALGVTHRVPHLAWASMEGEAKRDYPASIFFQSPWYKKYNALETYFGRINTALQSGTPLTRVAVLHPVESYWLCDGPEEQTAARRQALERQFSDVTEWLLFGLLDFDYVSESLLATLPHEEGKPAFSVGDMHYDAVVVPGCRTMRSSTLQRLKDFSTAGGTVIFLGDAPALLDAVPSGEPQKLAEDCIRIPFEQTALLEALEPLRLVDVRDSRGVRADCYLSQMRSIDDGRILFLANGRARENSDVPKKTRYTVRLAGIWAAAELCALTGETRPLPVSHEGGCTVLSRTLWNQDSLLLSLTPAKALAPGNEAQAGQEPELVRELHRLDGYGLEEPNVLLLDQAEVLLDGKPLLPSEEILRADTAVRAALGYPADGGNVAQPWTMPQEPYEHRVELRYTLSSQIPVRGCKLAMEHPERAEIRLNGQPVPTEADGWYVDPCIGTLPLPVLSAGENLLSVTLPYNSTSSLEWCYVLGLFGVHVSGDRARLTALPQSAELGFADLTAQGFPFYAGNFTYTCELEVEEGDYELAVTKFRCPVLSVRIDGREAGDIAFAPYRVPLGHLKGRHVLHITAYGNRINAFGPVHCCDETVTWWGPDSWRKEGDAFSYEYQLRRTGILSAPKLYRLR